METGTEIPPDAERKDTPRRRHIPSPLVLTLLAIAAVVLVLWKPWDTTSTVEPVFEIVEVTPPKMPPEVVENGGEAKVEVEPPEPTPNVIWPFEPVHLGVPGVKPQEGFKPATDPNPPTPDVPRTLDYSGPYDPTKGPGYPHRQVRGSRRRLPQPGVVRATDPKVPDFTKPEDLNPGVKILDPNEVKEKLLAELGKEYIGAVEGPFVVVGNLTEKKFQRVLKHTIRSSSAAMNKQFFKTKPDSILKVYLFKDETTYRRMAKKLFNDTDVSYFGYYKPGKKALVMNIGTGTGTLVHEMFHALAHPDFPQIPDWFNEGAASLFEQCSVKKNKLVGLMNWRFPRLRDAVKKGTHVPLKKLLSTDDFYGNNSGLHYAQARYLCMYLQEWGVLEKFYVKFRENHKEDPTGVKFLEEVLDKKLGQIEKDWLAWVKKLEYDR